MGKIAGQEQTPEEEAFFKRHPELGKAMEELDDEERWRRMKEHRLNAELHREEARKIIDDLKRSLSMP